MSGPSHPEDAPLSNSESWQVGFYGDIFLSLLWGTADFQTSSNSLEVDTNMSETLLVDVIIQGIPAESPLNPRDTQKLLHTIQSA